MLEKEIERKVRDYALGKHFLCYKFVSPSQRSVPDRVFIAPGGVVFFIEFKRLHATPTKRQQLEIETMRGKGANVYVVNTVEKGKKIIDFFSDQK